jgi:hypothetical protein
VIGGEPFRIVIACNGEDLAGIEVDAGKATLTPHPAGGELQTICLENPESREIRWKVRRAGKP